VEVAKARKEARARWPEPAPFKVNGHRRNGHAHEVLLKGRFVLAAQFGTEVFYLCITDDDFDYVKSWIRATQFPTLSDAQKKLMALRRSDLAVIDLGRTEADPTRLADTTPAQKLARHLLGVPLEDWVGERRAQGESWRTIADELKMTTGGTVDVNRETLRLWHQKGAMV
jgi:hypothetical protein